MTEEEELHNGKGSADGGADESVVSTRIDENAVINGIRNMKIIFPVTSQVALKDGKESDKYTLFRM